MDIISRNLFRLLRAGAFGREETVEPMSASKWRKTFQLAKAHDVDDAASKGLRQLSGQFFVQQMPDTVRQQWGTPATAARRPDVEMPKRITGKVEKLTAGMAADRAEVMLLNGMVKLSQALLTDTGWMRCLLDLGLMTSQHGGQTDRDMQEKWLKSLRLMSMAQLEMVMLTDLLGFDASLLPVMTSEHPQSLHNMASRLASAVPHGQDQWVLSQQGDNIFVRSSNSSAFVWHTRRTARFFRYQPWESVAQLVSTLTRSLTNIEE